MDIPQNIKAAFPNEVDLGRTPTEPGLVDLPLSKKNGKPEKYYPTLYISDVPGLESIPKEGYALIYFKRKSVTLRQSGEDDTSASADLEIQEICLPPTSKEDDEKDMKDAFAEFAAKAGAKDTGYDEGDDSDSEDMSDDDTDGGEE